jgi:hypothetical protein
VTDDDADYLAAIVEFNSLLPDDNIQPDSPVLRPDQLGMALSEEMIAEANALKEAYADGRTDEAYDHLTNVASTTAELMKGFGMGSGEVYTKPLNQIEEEENEL